MKFKPFSKILVFVAVVLLSVNCISTANGRMNTPYGLEPIGVYTFPTDNNSLGVITVADAAKTDKNADKNAEHLVSTKQGMSCVTRFDFFFILPIAWGDASVGAAASKGEIARVKSIAYKTKRDVSLLPPGLTGKYCTIAYGD
ncbi:TRL domain-containing protein [Leptospira ellisii]|uniref:TRL domain-containing protein n=1 Tax=Leptospira ellisii TaxID=2023197 RepID=A0A2N0B399_9LEPT|nr:TRL domain-containing protein [Leptospira ellisii]MDV6235033.1 TRL domain-containing protein [Leptospira ellisii]PJZ91012.1 hypothetical protein CH379_21080 [Leptospira ellisii]PKA04098.1 hypothetical protein CH375_13000 [Leptospira ellisii]